MTLAVVPSAARAQLRVDPQPVHRFGGDAMLWNGVVALDVHDWLMVVLTESDPVLHQFALSGGNHIRSWGEEGEGPGEFRSSADVALVGGRVYALDTTQRRVSVFDLGGRLLLTTPATGLGLPYANRLEHASGDTMVIRAYAPMGDANALVAWTVEGVAGTVLSFDDPPEELRLEAPGGTWSDAQGTVLAIPQVDRGFGATRVLAGQRRRTADRRIGWDTDDIHSAPDRGSLRDYCGRQGMVVSHRHPHGIQREAAI